MKLEKTYQAILDESFKSRFPEWEKTTALDPMKAFTEAVSLSLAEVERRQVRLTDVLVNSLPAFFGFERKQAQAGQHFFLLKEAQSLRHLANLSPGTKFGLLSGNRQIQAVLDEAMTLYPVDTFSFQREEKTISLQFSLRAGCQELRLFVLAKASEETHTNYVEAAEMEAVQQDSTQLKWMDGDLLVEDGSYGGTQNGYLTIRPKPGTSLFPQRPSDYKFRLTFAENFQAEDILFNVAPLSLRLVTAKSTLGELKGEPWEQLALPEEMIEIPREISLSLLNQEVKLHRVDIDILKIRTAEPERFEKSFFYEPFSHSLIFPGAHRLTEQMNSGVKVTASDAIGALPKEIDLKEVRFDAGDLRVILEGAAPLQSYRPFIARENPLDYLKRFYSAVRFFSSSQSFTAGILKDDLQNELGGAHPWVRRVEIDINSNDKKLDVYVLTHATEEKVEAHLPDAVVQALNDQLSKRVPLDYTYQILPFRRLPVEIQTVMTASVPSQRHGVVSSHIISERLETNLSKLLSPESFSYETSLTKPRVGEFVVKTLTHRTEDHTHLLENEIENVEFLFRRQDQGLYLDVLTRRTGEIFELSFDSQVHLLAGQTPEAPVRIRRGHV